MEVNNPNSANTWVSDDGRAIHCKVIEIGAWDMDTDSEKTVVHGMAGIITKILSINIFIHDDLLAEVSPLNKFDNNNHPFLVGGGIYTIDNNLIYLRRTTGGLFDSIAFNSILISRGFIVIHYIQ